MIQRKYTFDQIQILKHLVRWTLLVLPVAVCIGSLVALFLWLLDIATRFRWEHLWLIFLLPVAGVMITLAYRLYGKDSERGNNLIIDEIHEPGGGVPTRLAPFVLVSTIVTHLFGGSAGREGTAVQMGGSISSLFSKWYKLKDGDITILLMCGMSAGFGAVFGTPVAGTIFALEVLTIGSIKYDALIPCFIAATIADITCAAYGIHHTHYSIQHIAEAANLIPFISFDFLMLLKVILASVLFGLAGFLFAEMAHFIKAATEQYIKQWWLIPVVGAAAIIGISYLLGTFDYLGLGVINPNGGVSIVSAFTPGGATYFSWLWKLLLTATTISVGFKGGEVTPLFFIGATLGNAIATISGAPVDLFAGLGFIAVFAGATNTPLACTVMGIELFGGEYAFYFAVACFTAYYFSGHSGIYSAQRRGVSKFKVQPVRVDLPENL